MILGRSKKDFDKSCVPWSAKRHNHGRAEMRLDECEAAR